ncbi:MAG: hypothetical protein ACU4EQ_09270 [Candidatus Nitrosoglobus sp.]|jgi:hypothetical protein
MMKTSHLLILLGSFTLLSLSFYFMGFNKGSVVLSSVEALKLGDHKDEIASALGSLKEEVTQLRSEMATLKAASIDSSNMQRRFIKLQQEVAALQPRTENAFTADESGNAENFTKSQELTEQDIIAATEKQKEENRKHMEVINGVFLSEPVDYQWSTKTTDLITQSLGNGEQMQRIGLSNAECHTTLCRVEVNYHDAEAAREFQLQFPMQVGGALPQIRYLYEPQEDGSTNVVMYLARKGYDLPQVVQ